MKNILYTIILSFLFLFGCVQKNFSQFDSEEENINSLKLEYLKLIPVCDGKNEIEHDICVKNISNELSLRYADRYRAFYTAADIALMLVSQIIINYSSSAETSSTSSNSTATTSVKSGTCFMHKQSASHSVSLSSFIVVPVVCN